MDRPIAVVLDLLRVGPPGIARGLELCPVSVEAVASRLTAVCISREADRPGQATIPDGLEFPVQLPSASRPRRGSACVMTPLTRQMGAAILPTGGRVRARWQGLDKSHNGCFGAKLRAAFVAVTVTPARARPSRSWRWKEQGERSVDS